MTLNLYTSTSEEELIEGCRQNKARAQKALFDKYSGKMLGVVLRYIKDRDESEEVMITSFMKVFDKIDQFKSEGSFEGWIRRIMVNESLMYLRKHKNMYLEVDLEKADRDPNYGQLSDHLEEEDLLRMVQELPMGYRTVFNMYAIEGFSHAEIAEHLGINVNTSKSQLSRARALLQKQLIALETDVNNKLSRS
ncbi:MAG: sigma-70 family RNA polymerase sigma factor [Cyclobacteriaceae bacterium]